MASLFQGPTSTTALASHNGKKLSMRGSATTHPILNCRPVSRTQPILRGSPLVDFLDFLNTHYDGICRITHPNAPTDFEETREEIIQQLEQLLGPHAYDLFHKPQGYEARGLWSHLLRGVEVKLANGQDHTRWSKLNPNKVYSLLPGSGLNYSFAQPGHAEANIGYGIPEWMVRAVQRSTEIQYRAKADPSRANISIGNIEKFNKPQPKNEFQEWREYCLAIRESMRPALRELEVPKEDYVPSSEGRELIPPLPRGVSTSRLEHQRLREQQAVPSLDLDALDLHTPSGPAYDPIDQQHGHHHSVGLLFGECIPSRFATIPSHSEFLDRISDEDLKQENK
ncbi:hypothetical protein PG993_007421 [Apiospora rasikravindrae]|uniref:Uncharacterized protein n=1 Tax=Apiospora rasikravindrae TaxID=990691 RepID=A0ABR1SXG2_9PEZI